MSLIKVNREIKRGKHWLSIVRRSVYGNRNSGQELIFYTMHLLEILLPEYMKEEFVLFDLLGIMDDMLEFNILFSC